MQKKLEKYHQKLLQSRANFRDTGSQCTFSVFLVHEEKGQKIPCCHFQFFYSRNFPQKMRYFQSQCEKSFHEWYYFLPFATRVFKGSFRFSEKSMKIETNFTFKLCGHFLIPCNPNNLDMTSLLLLSSLLQHKNFSRLIFILCYRWSKRYQETIFPAPFWAKMGLYPQSQISLQNQPEINLVHDSKWLWKLYAIYPKFVSNAKMNTFKL